MYSFRIRASRRAAFLVIGFSLCVAASVWPANPKVTLKLQNVTAAEAMQALGKAGGVAMDLWRGADDPTHRASFDWQDVPLSRAMRELAAKFQLGFSSFGIGNGYHFVPLGGGVPGPSKYTLERKGVRVSLNGLTVEAQREEKFAGQQAQEDRSGIGLQFSVQLPDGDAETISGIVNLTAKDDQGNVLVSFGPAFSAPFDRGLPDEWTGLLNLPGYDPQARKLVWVEGEVQRYGLFQDNTVEFSLPVAPGAAHKEGNRLTVDVKKLELPVDGRESASAELQVTTPPQERPAMIPFDRGGEIKLTLVGASGKQYHPNSTESRGPGGQGARVSAVTCRWGRVPEKVVTLRVVSQERGDPEPLLAFRLTDVPLPRGGVFLRRKDAASGRILGEKAPERAFFDPAGGTLTGQLRVPRMTGLTGDVSYGLSPVSPEEKGVTRWIDVPLPADGSARLEHVKPGRYRVLRVFRPDEEPRVSEHGHWLHAEETVQVVAGKETVLPPLEWSSATTPLARPSK